MILAPFAGPGGWSEGLRQIGHADIGFEIDAAACATRRAAGHLTIRADVATYPLDHLTGKVEGLIMSPPCPDFSSAGKRKGTKGESGHLIHQVPRWTLALRPTWLACEQVPEALPFWRAFADQFRTVGYHCWSGILCAADFGVPQTRYRAILMAHADRSAQPPSPTHGQHPHPDMFGGPDVLPWVSMAEGLGWASA